jgi:uncharacterized protein DUF6249
MEGYVALFIPIVFFVCLLGAVALTLRFRTSQERERHETLRKMVEKGMEIPTAMLVPPSRPTSDLRRGLVLVGLGLGLVPLLMFTAEKLWAIGLVAILMGVAFLISWRLGLKERPAEQRVA